MRRHACSTWCNCVLLAPMQKRSTNLPPSWWGEVESAALILHAAPVFCCRGSGSTRFNEPRGNLEAFIVANPLGERLRQGDMLANVELNPSTRSDEDKPELQERKRRPSELPVAVIEYGARLGSLS